MPTNLIARRLTATTMILLSELYRYRKSSDAAALKVSWANTNDIADVLQHRCDLACTIMWRKTAEHITNIRKGVSFEGLASTISLLIKTRLCYAK